MPYIKSPELREHLKKEHRQSSFATYLKEIVYGGNDGIVTTFAVVAGFSGAALGNQQSATLTFATALLFGIANLFADGLSMALGNILSIRAEKDVYCAARKKEQHEIHNNTNLETEETIDILTSKGFDKQDAQKLALIYQKNPDYWTDWMMVHELEMSDPRDTNPLYTGLATFTSFTLFGAIPLIPFVIYTTNTASAMYTSALASLFALILLGILRWRIIQEHPVRAIGEIVIVGTIAASAAFMVGMLFRGV